MKLFSSITSIISKAKLYRFIASLVLLSAFSHYQDAFGYEFNCKVQPKDKGIDMTKNQSKDISKDEPVEVIKVFHMNDWSRYRCKSCYTGKTTGKLFCYCHEESNKPHFDIKTIMHDSQKHHFDTTVCRYCMSVGEIHKYSVMCYCKNFKAKKDIKKPMKHTLKGNIISPPKPNTHNHPPKPNTHNHPPKPNTHNHPPKPNTHNHPPKPNTHNHPPKPNTHNHPPKPNTHNHPPKPNTHNHPPKPNTHNHPPKPNTHNHPSADSKAPSDPPAKKEEVVTESTTIINNYYSKNKQRYIEDYYEDEEYIPDKNSKYMPSYYEYSCYPDNKDCFNTTSLQKMNQSYRDKDLALANGKRNGKRDNHTHRTAR